MKRILITLSGAVLIMIGLLLPTSAVYAANLVADGDMERGDLLEWRHYGNRNLFTYEKSNSQKVSGNQSMYIDTFTTNRNGGIQKYALHDTPVPVQAGKTYRYSFSYYLERGSLRTALGIRSSNRDFEGNVTALGGPIGQWHTYTRDFTVPDDFIADFRVVFNARRAQVYIDDVSIVEINQAQANAGGGENQANLGTLEGEQGYTAPVIEPIIPGLSTDEENPSIMIDGGKDMVGSNDVTLTFNVTHVQSVAISNHKDFPNLRYQALQEEMPWTLLEGNGERTVYVKFRSETGHAVYADATVTVDPASYTLPQAENANGSNNGVGGSPIPGPLFVLHDLYRLSCPLPIGNVYENIDTNTYFYVTPACTKRIFDSKNVLESYGDLLGRPFLTTSPILDRIPSDIVALMPWGPAFTPNDGDLVKLANDPRVFLLQDGKRYWIASEDVFLERNYQWHAIAEVDIKTLDQFSYAGTIQ